MKKVGPAGPGHAWWPGQTSTIVTVLPDANGIYQLYKMSLSTDKDKNKTTCMTCTQMPGGPAPDLNKGSPDFDPTGRYLAMEVEMAHHPGVRRTAGTGYYQDIWVLDTKTNAWSNLTRYPSTGVHGSLIPLISHDGKKMAWAELYQAPPKGLLGQFALGLTTKGPLFGYFHLVVADFVTGKNGVHLAHEHTYRPGNADFYETQAWSPDDSSLLFASDIKQNTPLTLNLWLLNLSTQKLTAITHDKSRWNEHATFFNNSNKKLIFMSSRCCHYTPNSLNYLRSLRTELYIMNADGSGLTQLTHFNSKGYLEYQPGGAVVNKPEFNADGTMLIVNVTVPAKTGQPGGSVVSMWLITFRGSCGGTRASSEGEMA